MPTIWREGGYRFHFYADEGRPREPPHIHVQKGRESAKFWLTLEVRLDSSASVTKATRAKLQRVVEEHRDDFERRYREFTS